MMQFSKGVVGVKLKVVLPVIFSGTLVALLAGCGSSPSSASTSGTVDITYATWFQNRYVVLTKLVNEFNKSHKHIHVTIEHEPASSSMLTKLLTELSTGTAPNVVGQFGPWADQLAHTKGILMLNQFVKQSHYNLHQFYAPAINTDIVGGKVIGLPADNDNQMIFYNKKLFEKYHVPFPKSTWTWAQFLATAKALNHPLSRDYGYLTFIGTTEGVTTRYYPFLWQLGGQIMNSTNTKTAFDSSAGVKSLAFLVSLAKYSDVVNRSEYENPFESGHVAMTLTGSWNVSSFVQAHIDYGVVALPSPTPGGPHYNVAGPDINLITKSTPAKEKASWTFLQYIESRSGAAAQAALGHLPIRPDVFNTPIYQATLKQYPALAQFSTNEKWAKLRPSFVQYSTVSQDIGTAIEEALLHKMSPSAALKQQAQAANQSLSQPAP